MCGSYSVLSISSLLIAIAVLYSLLHVVFYRSWIGVTDEDEEGRY